MDVSVLASYPWLIDAVLGIVFLTFACIKGVKGIYKVITPVITVVVALILATLLTFLLTGPVTDMIYPMVEDRLVKKLDVDVLTEEALNKLTLRGESEEYMLEIAEQVLPKGTVSMAKKLGIGMSSIMGESIKAVKGVDASEYLTEAQLEKLKKAGVELEAVKNNAMATARAEAQGAIYTAAFAVSYRLTYLMVRHVLWCVFSVALITALTLIVNTFGIVFELPVIGWVDKAGGALLGIVEVGLVLLIVCHLSAFIGIDIFRRLSEYSLLLKPFV